MLIPDYNKDVPESTRKVALAAFPKGNPYLTLHDGLGTIFEDKDFADLYPSKGQPTISPWRLALITIMQFRENLSDRQAAEAVRSRIDWNYLLGLELTDPGFDFSVLSEFRSRLLEGKSETMLLDELLEACRRMDLVKPRGKQRTDATHVLAAIRGMNRLEQVAETMRAALNEIAAQAPGWLQGVAPEEWYKRYGRRIEDNRLPQSKAGREEYGQIVAEDGVLLFDLITHPDAPEGLDKLPMIEALRQVWARHYEQKDGKVRFRSKKELSKAEIGLESPYDPDARFRSRSGTNWVGYIIHVSESCDDDNPHLITQVTTTKANRHESQYTQAIQEGLVDKGLAPKQHLVDSAYVDAELLIHSRDEQGISLIGPTRLNPSWQTKVDGAYDVYQFEVDWDSERVRCPQGHFAHSWYERRDKRGHYTQVRFSAKHCIPCKARSQCTRSKQKNRTLKLQPRPLFESLKEARSFEESEEGKKLYYKRAGVEGTVSQGVRAFGLRRTRYRGLPKTHLQHIATAAAINLDRIVAWFNGLTRAQTRTSRFAALAPT